MNEIWVTVNGYPKYEVNSYAEVRNRKTGHILEASYIGGDDLKVTLRDNYNMPKLVPLKRIVAEAFLGGPHPGCDIEYINGDSDNVFPENLRWVDWGETEKAIYARDVRKDPRIRVLETGKEFDSIYECSKKLGVTQKAVKRCLGNPRLICKVHCHLMIIKD